MGYLQTKQELFKIIRNINSFTNQLTIKYTTMKSALYVGATLMIGASIYGFVDYKKTSHDKEFTKMYEEPKTTEPVTVTDPVKNETVVKTETPVPAKTTAKKGVSKKQVSLEEETVPSIKPIAEDEKMVVDDKAIEKTTVTVTP